MHKIPLEALDMQEDGCHILVEAQLFGQSFKMVVDTGASKTVLDRATLLRSGVSEDRFRNTEILSSGLGTNTMQSFILEVPEIGIGGWQIRGFLAAVLDLSAINHAYAQMDLAPVVGVLGGDILRRYGAQIDYRKLLLTLRERPLRFP